MLGKGKNVLIELNTLGASTLPPWAQTVAELGRGVAGSARRNYPTGSQPPADSAGMKSTWPITTCFTEASPQSCCVVGVDVSCWPHRLFRLRVQRGTGEGAGHSGALVWGRAASASQADLEPTLYTEIMQFHLAVDYRPRGDQEQAMGSYRGASGWRSAPGSAGRHGFGQDVHHR